MNNQGQIAFRSTVNVAIISNLIIEDWATGFKPRSGDTKPMKDLPKFKRHNYDHVLALATEVMTRHPNLEESYLRRLDLLRDGHYRLTFDLDYFVTESGEPTKSQWNSLKKKLKRHDKEIFVFKEHGISSAPEQSGEHWGYLEFGFFVEVR